MYASDQEKKDNVFLKKKWPREKIVRLKWHKSPWQHETFRTAWDEEKKYPSTYEIGLNFCSCWQRLLSKVKFVWNLKEEKYTTNSRMILMAIMAWLICKSNFYFTSKTATKFVELTTN